MIEVINFTKNIDIQLCSNQLNFIREIRVIRLYFSSQSSVNGLHKNDGGGFHLLKHKKKLFAKLSSLTSLENPTFQTMKKPHILHGYLKRSLGCLRCKEYFIRRNPI